MTAAQKNPACPGALEIWLAQFRVFGSDQISLEGVPACLPARLKDRLPIDFERALFGPSRPIAAPVGAGDQQSPCRVAPSRSATLRARARHHLAVAATQLDLIGPVQARERQ